MDWTGLVDAIRAGDRMAGQRLVSALGALMDVYCEQIAPDLGPGDRDKVVEQALCDVVDRIDRFDKNRATLPTWARGFVRNGVREARRRPREIPASDMLDTLRLNAERDAALYGSDPSEDTPDDGPSAREVALAALLLLLKPSESTLLYAHAVEGLTFAQIAERLDHEVTEAALRKRYQRIRRNVLKMAHQDDDLRPLLDDPDPDPGIERTQS